MSDTPAPGRDWGTIVPLSAVLVVALGVCGWLGWWQWQRAIEEAVVVQPDPPVELTSILEPATNSNQVVGRQVTATGRWLDVQPTVVWDREVDGAPAAFLVRAFQPSEADATLAVVVGWLPPEHVASVETVPGDDAVVEISGYVRPAEGARGTTQEVAWAYSTGGMSTAELAQVWPVPLYSAFVMSDQPEPPWRVLPPREPETSVDFRSASYAIQWWAFGLFAAVVAVRWMRDNSQRVPDQQEVASP